ncbi:LPXTG cell wall anchor domain-containing protein, partial [Streptococcus bovimastitidis]
PAGYVPTTPNAGDDTLDSDGTVVKVTVSGNDNPTIDSGFVKEIEPQLPPTSESESNTTSEFNSQSTQESTSTSQSTSTPQASMTNVQLPHTGSTDNSSLFGTAALAILAALGLAAKKREEEE